MSGDMQALLLTAIAISFLHTLAGPDHYLPFIALSRSRRWSLPRTLFWTLVCGSGHVLSSVLLGLGGAAIGWSFSKIEGLEQIRGHLSGWMLLSFGALYTIWGLVRARRNALHKHFDVQEDGAVYVYEHKHDTAVRPQDRHAVTPWVLFLIFILGPCEPMIPLLYFPAAKDSGAGMLLLIAVYTVCTLACMAVMVVLGYYGTYFFKTGKLEKYMHALGGLTIFVCGIGMVFLEW
jgi:sulfite exporter TauE/SafE